MKKMTRILPLVALVALIAAIPASTQVITGEEDTADSSTNLPMLIAVNRLELTPEQMGEIHGLLSGLLETRDAHALEVAAFEEAMIAFNGTAEELDALLETRRDERLEAAEAHREQFADVIDQIKGILTIKQGEALSGALGGLLAGQGMGETRWGSAETPGQGMMRGMGRMGRRVPAESGEMMPGRIQGRQIEDPEGLEMMREQMEERFGDRAGTVEELRGRMAERLDASSIDEGAGRGVHITIRGQMNPGSAAMTRFGVRAGGGLDLVEQLVHVLELKLQAIE